MKKLITNANIITNAEPNEIRTGFIGITNDEIVYVGKDFPKDFVGDARLACVPSSKDNIQIVGATCSRPKGDNIAALPPNNCEIIDADGAIVMPGFVNAHTHIPMTLFRGVADDLSLHDWLFNHIVPMERELQPQDVYEGSKLALQEMIQSGTTCFCDMYFMVEQIRLATIESGLRANLGVGLTSVSGGQPSDEKASRRIKEHNSLTPTDKIKIAVSPHAVYTSSPKWLKHYTTLGNLIHIHISETQKENQDCIKEHGKTPTQLLKSLGYFQKEQTINAAHCVHLTDEDIQIFAQSGASITHCPSSNLKLASGIAPIQKYIDAGINVALGTDGAASNNALDMFNEIRLAALIHKGITGNPTAIPAQTAIEMATINGAKALGREHEIGKIAKGYKADLIFIETKSANMTPLATSLCSAIAYSASSKNLIHTMVGGETLFVGGGVLDAPKNKILKECK